MFTDKHLSTTPIPVNCKLLSMHNEKCLDKQKNELQFTHKFPNHRQTTKLIFFIF